MSTPERLELLLAGWICLSLLVAWLASRWFRALQRDVVSLEDVVIQIQRERGRR